MKKEMNIQIVKIFNKLGKTYSGTFIKYSNKVFETSALLLEHCLKKKDKRVKLIRLENHIDFTNFYYSIDYNSSLKTITFDSLFITKLNKKLDQLTNKFKMQPLTALGVSDYFINYSKKIGFSFKLPTHCKNVSITIQRVKRVENLLKFTIL